MNSPAERITEYLSLGGLFNPEMMNHDAVSALLIDCRAELSRLSALVAWQPTHRHVKTGGEYALIGIGTMQAAKWIDPIPPHGLGHPRVDMREVAIYRGADGKLWARPSEEFDDGRFEALPAPPVSQLKDTTNADK